VRQRVVQEVRLHLRFEQLHLRQCCGAFRRGDACCFLRDGHLGACGALARDVDHQQDAR